MQDFLHWVTSEPTCDGFADTGEHSRSIEARYEGAKNRLRIVLAGLTELFSRCIASLLAHRNICGGWSPRDRYNWFSEVAAILKPTES